MHNYYNSEWTGSYPNLCYGEWKLYKNGDEVNTEIPFRYTSADTFGTYHRWYFNSDWHEEWEDYEDGLPEQEWIANHQKWLRTIAPKTDWPSIYHAFAANDFREGECGGCI